MRTLKSVFLIATAALAVTACTKRPVLPEFEPLVIDTLLGQETSGCKVEYRFATIRNAASSPALEAIEQSNIGYFFELEDFTGNATQAAEMSLRQLSEEFCMPDSLSVPAIRGLLGEISVESEGMVLDTLVSFSITRSAFTGGAHGMYGTEYHTYSLTGGYELTLADLFSEDQARKLAALIRTKLYEQYEVADDQGLIEKGFFPEYIDVTENFRITPEGMIFQYNPYEIGCYALGDVEVTISREELEAL